MLDPGMWAAVSAALAVACARVHLVGFLYAIVGTALALALMPTPPGTPPLPPPPADTPDAVSSRRAMTANPRKAAAMHAAPVKRLNGAWPMPPTAEANARKLKALAAEFGLA